ncbi:hypothetical protein CEXT_449271 [Caerostris extrusa]|uniref:Uncharacterized protein n=1 Tax=Caerostris extrusa TaxID=172846 RepID=A0AAV4T033_CAEEX|nr:hypothetical protein CEXT_449271 [Caerostris extrusa]
MGGGGGEEGDHPFPHPPENPPYPLRTPIRIHEFPMSVQGGEKEMKLHPSISIFPPPSKWSSRISSKVSAEREKALHPEVSSRIKPNRNVRINGGEINPKRKFIKMPPNSISLAS